MDAPIEPVEEGLQNGPAHCADLVPDDDVGYVLLTNLVRRPVILTTPSEEAVVGLDFDTSIPHFFREPVGRGEDQGISLAEQFNRSCGLATSATTVHVGQSVSGQMVIVAWCGANVVIAMLCGCTLFRLER